MTGHKAEIGWLQLTIARPEPPIWISRLVIYESTSPLVEVRSQPLHRGLNIVWGEDEISQGSHVEPVPGHSVGKTTFCRLLRYCLGEAHCADEQTRKSMLAEFPMGYVGAEVHVAGQVWAVARPLGRATLSYARMDCKVEDIFSDRPLPQSFQEYRMALMAAGLNNQSPRPDLPLDRVWGHFLAWCARDQEARYESLWGWRSPRSGSDSPAFDRPKGEAVRFIRTVAGILSKKEIRIQRVLEKAMKDIEDNGTAIEERERLPGYWCRHYREELQRLGVEQPPQGGEQGALFDPSNAAEGRRAAIGEEVRNLDQELKDLDYQISITAARTEEIAQLLDGYRALATDTSMNAAERTAALAKVENLLHEIRDAANKPCKFGGINVGECSYAKENLITVGSELQKARRTAGPEVAQLDQEAATATARVTSIAKTVFDLKEEHQSLLAKRREVENKRSGLLTAADSIKLAITELGRWSQYYRNDAPDPDLLSLRRKLRENEEKAAEARLALTEERAAQEASLGALRRVFNGLVQSILSQEYQGRVTIVEDDLEFRVSRGTRLAGEALQTLSVLLADLSCMIMGAEGGAIHPGFLLHDSPREADLGLRVYQNYLQFMWRLYENLGGADASPFQYIVTTTTPPPKDVQDSDAMALKLNMGNLLLGRVLPEPKPDDADPAEEAGLWQ